MSEFTIHHGDALAVLRGMPDSSVNCCVTSPPYYGLRDYGTGQWEGGDAECDHVKPTTNYNKGFNARWGNGDGTAPQKQEVKSAGQYSGTCKKCGARRVDGQIGLEETPEAYIARLVDVFREVRRVLADDGTLWVNIGDSYAANGVSGLGTTGGHGAFNGGAKHDARIRERKCPPNVKVKDLIGIPWMLAFALRADGWYLRSEIIWHKPNPMPESVKDRPTKAHEQIFLLSKSPKYFYDADAVKEPCSPANVADFKKRKTMDNKGNGDGSYEEARPDLCRSRDAYMPSDFLRNRRSVWTVTPKPYKEAHFATFPPDLIKPCILAGCPEGGTVLDPFGGSGTTAQVAIENGRNAVLIELNPAYIELMRKRLASVQPSRAIVLPLLTTCEHGRQPHAATLFEGL